MGKLSVVVSAFNAQDRLTDCLKSIKDVADEIIVVNNSSMDDTENVAKKLGAKVFTRPNNPMLNSNKNFGFSRATGEWILNLDDDEIISTELAKEIKSVISDQVSGKPDGYLIPRKNIIFGKWIAHTGWYPDYQLRLFRNGKGKFAEKHVHELIQVDGKTEKLENPIIHQNYQFISQFIRKLNDIYTPNEAEQLLAKGYTFRWVDVIRKPVEEFIHRFFAEKGYLDGLHGLVLSLLMAFYHLIIVLRIWEKEGFKEVNEKNFLNEVYNEVKQSGLKFQYWFLTACIDGSKNAAKKLYYKTLRKKVNSQIRK